jgi:3-dehydroquinate dehydratase-2
MARVLVLFGPNLNLLGEREPAVYGTETFEGLSDRLRRVGQEEGLDVDVFQSNHEGDLIDRLHRARHAHAAVVINAGALTHTSIALRDAVAALPIPVVEAHLTNIHRRETFRRRSWLASVCAAGVQGFGSDSMILALRGAAALLRRQGEKA